MARTSPSPRSASVAACCLAVGLSLAGGPALASTSAAGIRPVLASAAVRAPEVAASGAVDAAPMPDGKGFWTVTSAGAVQAYGTAPTLGDLAGRALNAPVVGIASTPDGDGYWLVAADGGIFSFGDATYHGSTGNLHLNQPIVGMASTPDGNGYWLVAADGGIFSFGTAPFYGSASGALGGGHAVGIVATAGGYWITSFGGGVLSYGGAAVLQSPLQASSSLAIGTADPAANTAPTAAFASACYSFTPSAACDAQALSLIDSARSGEGLGPLALPSDYSSLSTAQQLFVVTNAERTARGLPAFSSLTAALDSRALAGAQATQDPTGPSGVSWASNLAWGLATPLAADFEWMYDDGVGSSNVDCTSGNTSGCWGHRHDILVPWGGSMGAAVATVDSSLSMTELFAEG
jgi:hypothetical protein